MPVSFLDNLCKTPVQRKTLVMGILNVTPDSFSDGGLYANTNTALEHAQSLINEGADILDIGGESSRPGATRISAQAELDRVLPVITAIRKFSSIPISLDTVKAEVADAGLKNGVNIINDISALKHDPTLADIVATHNAGLILMHMQGTPATMQDQPHYDDVVHKVRTELLAQAEFAQNCGVQHNNIILDPGIGFGKTLAHNLALLSDNTLSQQGYPVLIGCSRKSFIGEILGENIAKNRLNGSLASIAIAVLNGVSIVRVHDVKATVDFFSVFDTIQYVNSVSLSSGP